MIYLSISLKKSKENKIEVLLEFTVLRLLIFQLYHSFTSFFIVLITTYCCIKIISALFFSLQFFFIHTLI